MQILVVLLMEAASALLEQGFKPHRTLMFAFGHDEELMGLGAGTVCAKQLPSLLLIQPGMLQSTGLLLYCSFGMHASGFFVLLEQLQASHQSPC
jgi:hypothetical protein